MELNVLGYEFVLKSVMNCQQQRSFNQNQIAKSDLWDSKNWFKNQVFEIIKRLAD